MNDLMTIDPEPEIVRDLATIDQPPMGGDNPAVVYVASLAEGSQRSMRQALDIIAKISGWPSHAVCPWGALRAKHTSAIRARLIDRYSAASARKMLSALRGTLKQAWRMQQIPTEDYQRAVDLNPIKGEGVSAAAGRALSQKELNALMRACNEDGSPAGARDAAIIALAYATGARRSEIVGLNLSDLVIGDGRVQLVIRGKGNKVRTAYLKGVFAEAMRDWLAVRGDAPGPLFYRLQLGGHGGSRDRRFTTQAVYGLLAARGQQAGLEGFSPHDLRRTCISNHIDAGTDLVTVAQIVGHANVQTTARYDRRGERAKEQAADNLHIAYEPRRRR